MEQVKTVEQRAFVVFFERLQEEVHENARAKGFWDGGREDGTCIALIHSELSEALEALRESKAQDDKLPEFSGVEVELADTIIRIMDMAQARGYRVAEALLTKINFNHSRPMMHGKLF